MIILRKEDSLQGIGTGGAWLFLTTALPEAIQDDKPAHNGETLVSFYYNKEMGNTVGSTIALVPRRDLAYFDKLNDGFNYHYTLAPIL